MSIPLRHTLGVKRHSLGSKNARGIQPDVFATAVDWAVFGYAPGANVEPGDPNRDLSLIEWTVYAPNDADAPTERDRVVLGGDEYVVAGRLSDWTKGPWNMTAGIAVELKRAEG